jgi:hypothetical protein
MTSTGEFTEKRFNTIGPSVGQELRTKSLRCNDIDFNCNYPYSWHLHSDQFHNRLHHGNME